MTFYELTEGGDLVHTTGEPPSNLGVVYSSVDPES